MRNFAMEPRDTIHTPTIPATTLITSMNAPRTDSRSTSHATGITTGVTSYISRRITMNGLLQAGRQWIDTNNYDRIRGAHTVPLP
jgi:hypothetical protein